MAQIQRIICIIVLLFSFSKTAFTQKPFSTDPATMVKELGEVFKTAGGEKGQKTYEGFKDAFEKKKLEEVYITEAHQTLNKMVSYKMKTNEIEAFLGAILVFVEKPDNKRNFENWIVIANKVLDDYGRVKALDFVNFCNFSENLFRYDALYYENKMGENWYFGTPNYQLKYEDKKPILSFNTNIDLRCVSKQRDSIIVKNTSGTYFVMENLWRGKSGKVDWSRAGLGEEVYCTFNNYKIETKKSSYIVDTVTFYYPTYFKTPIKGRFEDKTEVAKQGDTNYPQFVSFKDTWEIEQLGEGISYRGGFRLNGSNFIGQGSQETPALVRIYTKDRRQLLARASSETFAIKRGQRVMTQDASVSIYFDTKDSIFHPSIRMQFDIPKREMLMERDDEGSSRALFFNSYHLTDINSDNLRWVTDSSYIEIGKKTVQMGVGGQSGFFKETTGDVAGATSDSKSTFESQAFFSEKEYVKFQSISDKSPLAVLASITNADTRTVDIETFAKSINSRYSAGTITGLIQNLNEGGFIYYNPVKKEITVRDKVFHYADAYTKKKDYDLLLIRSEINGANGRLNLKTKELQINGVKNLMLSDSQMVAVEPIKKSITVLKNRNMNFGGGVFAGYGLILGRKNHFDYDKFQITMDSIDVFSIRVPNGTSDANGTENLEEIETQIEDTNGVLTIADPQDKSGLKYKRDEKELRRKGVTLDPVTKKPIDPKTGQPMESLDRGKSYKSPYPSLETKSISHAYYSEKFIQNGAYTRDKFFFELQPFVFDSMHTYDPQGLIFDGQMVSAKIFPTFKEKLRVRPDRSLGFKHSTPPEGYAAYQNAGNYKGVITLDNTGMRGIGGIEYLTSDFKSDSITFLPDRMTAEADRFDIAEKRGGGVQFPKVEGLNVSINWKPYSDDMEITSKKNPFQFFGQDYKLKGKLNLRSKGLQGSGRFDWKEAVVDAKLFDFGPNYLRSDTANVGIRALDSTKLAFNSRDVKVDMDFDKQYAKITNNTTKYYTELPYNEYVTTFDKFDWDMKAKLIKFNSSKGLAGKFISTRSQQDSLSFKGDSGEYNLTSSELTVKGVNFVNSADALIYPADKQMIILPGAVVKTLENAKIVSDTINQYHVINRATVDIKGKKSYLAKGYYEYNVGDKQQEILFNNIGTAQKGKQWITKAGGDVTERDNFLVDKKISYRGKVFLSADDKNLTFDGFCQLKSATLRSPTWFGVKTPIDRKNVVISYDLPKTPSNDIAYTEIRLNNDQKNLYPLIMRTPRLREDRPYFSARGALRHDFGRDEFYFGDSLRVSQGITTGNMLTYYDRTGKYKAEGRFRIGELMKPIITDIAGEANGTVGDSSINNINFMMAGGIKLPIPEKALDVLIQDINAQADLADLQYDATFLARALPTIMPTDRANKALESVGLGYLNIPKEAGYTFFFGKLPFKWSIENASFYVKDKVSITSIGERSLNKSIQGHLEFRTIIKESGVSEVFHLYLELPNTNYYYINYEGGVLSLLSSNPDFTTAISSLKKKELKVRIREDGKIIKVGGDDKEEDLAENGGKKPKKEKKPKKKKDDPEPTEEPTGDEPIEEPIEEPTEEPTGDEPAAPKVKLKENEIQIQLCEPMKMNFFIERMRSER